MHNASVDVTGIWCFIRVILVRIIVHLTNLIPAVKNRNSRLHKHIGMKHHIHLDCLFHSLFIMLESSLLHTTHRSSCSAESCISCNRILIVKNTSAVALSCIALEIIIQVFLMRAFLDSFLTKSCIIQPPANVIMTAQIIEENVILRKSIYNIQLFLQKTYIPCGNCMPGGSHCGNIVKHMALWFLHRSEIRNHLFRLHNNLSKEKDSRTHDLADKTHHPDNGMHLGKVSAGGVQNSINTEDIDSLVCQKQEIVHHLIKYPWVSVIQVPLIRVKGCHYIVSDFRQPGKIARCCCRKNLRHCFLIK